MSRKTSTVLEDTNVLLRRIARRTRRIEEKLGEIETNLRPPTWQQVFIDVMDLFFKRK